MPNRYGENARTPQQIAAGYASSLAPAPTPDNPSGFDPRQLPQGSNPSALTIDQVNIAMRASPVWNSWMQQHGKDPRSVHLSDSDKNGLGKSLELAGFPLPDGWEIDNSGNIREQTHKLRNTLITAGIVGGAFGGAALLAAYGGASAAGAGGAAAAGAGGGTTAGVLGSTAIGSGYLGGIAGGTGLAGAAGTAGALGGAGLASSTIGSGYLGGIAGGTGGVGAGTAGGLTAGSGTIGSLPAGGGMWSALDQASKRAKQGKGIWDSVAAIGADASAAGYGRAAGRLTEAELQQRQDQLALERYQAGLQGTTADLAQRRFGLEAPGMRASNAVRGDVLANAQDVSFSGLPPRLQGMIPTISGGLRPSMFSPATRQLGGLLSSQALEGQQKGDTFAPLPTLPSATPLPSGNALDTGLTLGGTAASLAPSFWDLLDRYRKRKATGGAGDYPTGGSGGSSDEPGWEAGFG